MAISVSDCGDTSLNRPAGESLRKNRGFPDFFRVSVPEPRIRAFQSGPHHQESTSLPVRRRLRAQHM
jgi:hypothetical protein